MDLTPFKICFVFVTKYEEETLRVYIRNRLNSILEISLLHYGVSTFLIILQLPFS